MNGIELLGAYVFCGLLLVAGRAVFSLDSERQRGDAGLLLG
jgi:hypothetical protein